MDDVLKDLSRIIQYCDVRFAKLDAEEVPEVSKQYKISAVPVIVFIYNGEEIDRMDGANAMTLTKKMEIYADKQYIPKLKEEKILEQKTTIEDRMKSLVNQAPCMVFMKGTPTEPKCGYSARIVKILSSCNIDYKSYNILEDDEARSQLKIIFGWPTFPQLYFNGELLGGVDIIQEMYDLGELEKLPKKK